MVVLELLMSQTAQHVVLETLPYWSTVDLMPVLPHIQTPL